MLTKIKNFFASKKTAAKSVASPVALEDLEGRQLMSSTLALGINANQVSASTYAATVKMLHDTGTKSVRLWYGFSSYGTRSEAGLFKYVNQFAADGFDVMLSVVPNGGIQGSPEQVKGLFNWLLSVPGLKNSVDRWQVGNEPDHAAYWKGSLSSYVSNFLKPASEALHAQGEKVVSAGPSWNPEDVHTLVNAGMLNYADFVGYHPYRPTLTDLKACVAQVKAYAQGKPLVASEWNVRGQEGSSSGWANALANYWPVIRDNFYAAYYYAAVKSSSMAGAAGVITSSGGQNGPFYGTYRNFQFSMSGASTPVAPSTPSTSTTGNTASSTTTAPKISSFTIINASTGKAISGYSGITSSKTIKLSSLPTRNIQILATANSGTQSVKFSFTGLSSRTENTAPYNAFNSAWTAKTGTFSLKATAYSKDNASGTAGNTLSITLKFVA